MPLELLIKELVRVYSNIKGRGPGLYLSHKFDVQMDSANLRYRLEFQKLFDPFVKLCSVDPLIPLGLQFQSSFEHLFMIEPFSGRYEENWRVFDLADAVFYLTQNPLDDFGPPVRRDCVPLVGEHD